MDRELSRFETRLLAIEDLTKGVHSKDSQWIEVAIESYWEWDKKKLKGLDR